MNILFYGFAVFLFAAVILAVEATFLWWTGRHGSAARRIAQRLHAMSAQTRSSERISILKDRRFSRHDRVDGLLRGLPMARRIDQLLVQAGAKWTVEHFVGSALALGLFGLLLISSSPVPVPLQIGFVAFLLSLPYLLATRARSRRLITIETQLPEAADFIARALRAGHSFSNVLQIVGTELPEPLSSEFRQARAEITYGVPMSDALHNMAERIPLTDFRFLIIAVLIQRESGGNLAEILTNIGQIIRGRLKLVAQVRVLSAEGKMSAWILSLLPFVVLFMMSILNPGYISTLWTDPTGLNIVWAACGMLVVGIIWLRKIIRIRI